MSRHVVRTDADLVYYDDGMVRPRTVPGDWHPVAFPESRLPDTYAVFDDWLKEHCSGRYDWFIYKTTVQGWFEKADDAASATEYGT